MSKPKKQNNIIKNILRIIIAGSIFFIEQVAATMFVYKPTLKLLCISLSVLIAMCIVAIWYMYRHNKKYHDQKPTSILSIIKTSIYGTLVILFTSVIANIIMLGIGKLLHIVNKQSANQELLSNIQHHNSYGFIFIIILTIIVGPILEEFVFRYIPTINNPKSNLWLTIFGILFVIAHLLDDFSALNLAKPSSIYIVLTHAVTYAVPAIVFSVIYARKRNMANNIATHALGNALSIIL